MSSWTLLSKSSKDLISYSWIRFIIEEKIILIVQQKNVVSEKWRFGEPKIILYIDNLRYADNTQDRKNKLQ